MILSQLGPNLRALSDRRPVALYMRGKCRVYVRYTRVRQVRGKSEPGIGLVCTPRVPGRIRRTRPVYLPSGYTFLTRVPLGVPVPFRCLDSARGMEPSWKLRDCRAARHRLLAGWNSARGEGWRTDPSDGSVRAADPGPGGPGSGEATPARAPARPLGSLAGVVAPRPARELTAQQTRG
jgi:hypothetical protein